MLGKRIKELRLAHKINQVELGKALNVSKQTISNWENDNIPPSIDTLVRLSKYFQVSTDYLLGLDNKRVIPVEGLTNEQIAHIQHIIEDILS